MGYQLDKYSAGTLDKGVQARTMDFQTEVNLALSSYSMSQGLQQGLAPRPGMSPVPGMADNEVISGSRLPGLRAAEGTPSIGFSNRRRVLAVFPLRIADPANVTLKITAYAWLITTVIAGQEFFDIVVSSTVTGGSLDTENPTANIYDGFGIPSVTVTALGTNYFTEALVPTTSGSKAGPLSDFLLYQGQNFLSSILMSVTGANIPMGSIMGHATAVGDATHAPSVGMHFASGMTSLAGTATLDCGVPTEYNLQNFTSSPRAMKIFALNADGTVNIQYSVTLNPSATTFKQDIYGAGIVTLDLSGVTASKDTGGTTYSNTKSVLVNDPAGVDNSSYKAFLVAAQRPVACVFQDAYKSQKIAQAGGGPGGKSNQWFDLTQNIFQPQAANSDYTEEAISKKVAFNAWPVYVQGTTLVPSKGIALTDPNTGVLRSNTIYEFTYSVYNKRLNFETNVGAPVRIQTGDDDFVALQLWTPPTPTSTTETYYSDYLSTSNGLALAPPFNPASQNGVDAFMNHLQYRFYYRVLGTASWLPTLFIDMPQMWFYPHATQLLACTGAIAALPGGEPGGFNDYSPLARDSYSCVVQYKDRAFWVAEKQINFSLRNNIFCYPGRNSISAVSGEFKGAIIHNYPGQADQNARLIIFGTTTTYVARFTGQPQQANVQVSADDSGVFDIDGSDLEIDAWTSVTAFSYRAAVVAEGILYWWGPQGVFRDDGVNTPTRISPDLEPDLFTLYDPAKTDSIMGNYNTQTKEIEWIFTPKAPTGDEVNRSIIFNTISGNWTPGRYTQQIDWLQQMTVETNIGTAGLREVIGTRVNAAATTQRAYYFDQRNRSGDMCPTRDWVIKTIATPSAGLRRLTLAAGYDATNFASIAVGDLIALQQTTSYASSVTANDQIAKVAAISTGSGTIDITVPTTGILPASASLTYDQYFPFWHAGALAESRGQNAIAYNLETQYWMAGGLGYYAFWLYLYIVAKMKLWACDVPIGWDLSYRTPTALGYIDDEIPFANNSDGNFQVYHPLRPGDDNQEGQGLKLRFAGYHIGHEWVLQYLEAHAQQFTGDGDPLKRFEG